MTIDFTPKSNWATYGKCNKPAKFKVPNPKMGVEYVCGIHARSLDKMFERTGQNIRCLPI
jgi:hypothetical protein